MVGSVPSETLPALRLVKLAPLPLKLVAVTVPAVKLPEASRLTMVLAVFALVAALAALAPLATAAAASCPTLATDVALRVPVTSPLKLPLTLEATLARMARSEERRVGKE